MVERVECGPIMNGTRSDACRQGFDSDCDSDDRIQSFDLSCSNFPIIGEFDPGSGRTLAACLTHVSRTGLEGNFQFSGRRVRNT